jgi:serine/threonine-protein kinase RsbW
MTPPKPDPNPPALVIRLTFRSEPAAVRAALDRICAALDRSGVPDALLQPSRIVLAEVFNNIAEHAFGGRADGTIGVQMTAGANTLCVTVRDRGAAMPDGPLPGDRYPYLDPETPLDWPEGGFGWAMVRDLTQNLVYERRAGENILHFRILPENR